MSLSLTAKLNKKRLADTLRRRKAAQTVTHLIDHSVPSEVRFHGILNEQKKTQQPIVRVADSLQLSPYIIHLNAHLPSPEEILAETSPLVAPNLLVPEKFFLSIADAEKMNPVEDLQLELEDVYRQMREDSGQEMRSSKFKVRNKIESEKITKGKENFEHPFALKAGFTVTPFELPKAPENFAAYFEMPDSEENEPVSGESEIVVFDKIILPELNESVEVVETSVPVFGTSTSSVDKASVLSNFHFNFPHFDFPKFPTGRLTAQFSFLPANWHKTIGAFVLASFIFVLPLHAMNLVSDLRSTKSGLAIASQTALAQLQAGASAVLVRDASTASTSFGKAEDAFSQAEQSVEDLGGITSLLLSVIPATGSTYRTGSKLLEVGTSLSIAGGRISEGFLAAQNELNPTPTSRLKLLTTYVSSALPNLSGANDLILSIDPTDVPETQRDAFTDLANRLPVLVETIQTFLTFADMADVILGGEGSKRYLVVFQNNTEVRATGGFMGSFAEISVQDGIITNMNVPGGGTYDLQGSLRETIAAPEPLQLLSARWEFQDANWFPDFPTTARQVTDFYEDAGGGTVDGVIAVNATYIADLISLLGPIDMPEYNRTITSDNFLAETQKIVELEYDREENRPKAFIGDLAPLLLERVMNGEPEEFLTLLDRVNQGLLTRDIQIYFSNDELEKTIRDFGWGGELKQTTSDYLMIVNTNLGGGKTDGVISEQANVSVNIDPDGIITNTLTVTRRHFGEPGALFTGVNNVDYVRVYVPQGATLLSATGFTIPDNALFDTPPEDWATDDDLLYSMDTLTQDPASLTAIYNETGKTVFGNWVQTKPGESSTYTFTYRLPFSLSKPTPNMFAAFAKNALGIPTTETYSLLIQKQSGILDRTTNISVHIPDTMQKMWASHDLNSASFENTVDGYLGMLLEKK